MPTSTSASAFQAPSAPGRRVRLPPAISPAAQRTLKGPSAIVPSAELTGSSASMPRMSGCPVPVQVRPKG
jgi:hypothetical protein